jgi:hypothetical protein
MALDITPVLNQVASHAMKTGYFERVNTHEPKNAPGNGLTCAIWVDGIAPTRTSGLAATSVVLKLNVRVYNNMLQEPQDDIDPNVVTAVQALMNAYSGDFDLGSTVANIDLLGSEGTPMSMQSGYLTLGTAMYRAMVVVLPIIINDVWSQSA